MPHAATDEELLPRPRCRVRPPRARRRADRRRRCGGSASRGRRSWSSARGGRAGRRSRPAGRPWRTAWRSTWPAARTTPSATAGEGYCVFNDCRRRRPRDAGRGAGPRGWSSSTATSTRATAPPPSSRGDPTRLHLLDPRRHELSAAQGGERPRRASCPTAPATRNTWRRWTRGSGRRWREAEADLAIYLAGADPFVGDRLGRLALTKDGLAERDRLVLAARPGRRVAGGGDDGRRLRPARRRHGGYSLPDGAAGGGGVSRFMTARSLGRPYPLR